jgi:predicted O-linked N-acetylglucosamine transferase (SPINDLY family)
MGSQFIDYIIADQKIIPIDLQEDYAEKVIYLPSYQANDSKKVTPNKCLTREELNLPSEAFIYCCFNNNYKFTPRIFDSWANILSQVEGSVLFLYAETDSVKENLLNEISSRGIDRSRLVFGDRVGVEDYLARYKAADLFLDTSPYNAGTTASDALWVGLPVLTFTGQSFSARMGASLLNAIGLPELVASSQDQYEELAIELGRSKEKLLAIKEKLAANRLSMPLFDTLKFTRNLEAAYVKAYDRLQRGLSPDHIY